MRILVTGGGGFIGKALVKRLLKEGHQVSSLSRGTYPELTEAGVNVFRTNILDKQALIQAFVNQDIVFHVAAKAGFWGPYSKYYRANVLGTLNVIDACRENNIKHLVFTSSASVVFDGNNIKGGNENIPYPNKSLSHYTATKAISEKAILNANGADLKTISLRPHLVWGPGDRHIVPRIVEQAKAGKLRMIGSGSNIVDTTYIDNVVEAHMCTLNILNNRPEAWGKAYFISNDQPVKLWDFLNNILEVHDLQPLEKKISSRKAFVAADIIEKTHKFTSKGKPPRITSFLVHELTSSHWFDISAAKKYLGYKPRVTNEEGLIHLADSIKTKPPTSLQYIQPYKELGDNDDPKIFSITFLREAQKLEKKGLSLKSIRTAWNYLRKTTQLVKSGAKMVGNEAIETQAMAAVFFRMLETKLDLKNRKEPPTEDEVKAAINQLKDVGRISLFATVSILPGGAFSLIGLELLARKFGIVNFTLVPSAFRKKSNPPTP